MFFFLINRHETLNVASHGLLTIITYAVILQCLLDRNVKIINITEKLTSQPSLSSVFYSTTSMLQNNRRLKMLNLNIILLVSQLYTSKRY